MQELPPQVRTRLAELSRRFREGLPSTIALLEQLQARADAGDVDATRELRLRVHRVAGSATTFGLDELTNAAREAEQAIERDLATVEQIPSEATTALLERMKALALAPAEPTAHGRRAGDAEPSATDADADAEPERPERLIVAAGDTSAFGTDLADQLAVFGVNLVRVESVAEFRELVVGRRNSSGPSRGEAIFLANVEYLSDNVARADALQELRDEYPGLIQTILCGRGDDFDSRLRSVRYGADAFLARPLDVTQLVDKLESLTGQYETAPYHVLIVDDDTEQVAETAHALQSAGMITSVVSDPRNIFQVLVEYKPELILMDMYMPGSTGVELAKIIRQNSSFVGIPIVFHSIERDQGKQLEAVRSGGDGFLEKPVDPEMLVTSVRLRAARARAMRFYMERDSLTGLLNHTNLKQRLEHDMQRAGRIGTRLVFAMIDIDHFKSVNDTYGHLTGDRVLKSLARLLEERLRRTDVVGRYGGEEFGVILFNTDAVNAVRIMNGIRDSFSRIHQSSASATFHVTFSCGLAEFPAFDTPSALNEAADGALYRAKERGRNAVMAADSVTNGEAAAK